MCRVRGIPSDGYQTVALLEDGIPIQGDPGLGWLNGDQSLRIDQSVERIEVVRGGPSAIFYSNAPGAAINFITRKGGDTLEGLVRYEAASYNSHRVDGWIGGPIGASGWHVFAGGYYRVSDGPHNSGFTQDRGGQLRVNVSKAFERGDITFGVKRIDERVGYWGGGIYQANANGTPSNVVGLDNKVDNIVGPDTRYFNFLTPNGAVKFDDGVGSSVKLTQFSFQAHYDISDAFKVEENVRYRTSWTQRNSITPYTVAASASALLTSTFGKPAAGTGYALLYRDSGAAFNLVNQNGNGLALIDLARTHTVPLDEFITDTRLVGKLDLLGTHNLAFGVYYAREQEDYNALSAAVLTDVKAHAEVLDAYLVDAKGNKLFKISDNGVIQYGAEFANASGSSDNIAAYASDEWQLTPKFRLEGGRALRADQDARAGRKAPRRSISARARRAPMTRSASAPGCSRPSRANTIMSAGPPPPIIRRARSSACSRATPTRSGCLRCRASSPTPMRRAVVQTLNMLEGGIKYSRGKVDLYVTGFRTVYNSYAISDYQRLANGLLSPVTVYGDTKTTGTEIEGTWRPTNWFDLHASWTWQDNRFSKFVYTNSAGVLTDYSHHKVNGVPDNTFRITPGVTLFDRKVRLQSDVNHVGALYTDVANQIRLPSYWSVDFAAQFQLTPKLQFGLIVANVTNAFGLGQRQSARGHDRQQPGRAAGLYRQLALSAELSRVAHLPLLMRLRGVSDHVARSLCFERILPCVLVSPCWRSSWRRLRCSPRRATRRASRLSPA